MIAATPALGLSQEEVHTVLETASPAPSVHNSRPWRFLVRSDRIELHVAKKPAVSHRPSNVRAS